MHQVLILHVIFFDFSHLKCTHFPVECIHSPSVLLDWHLRFGAVSMWSANQLLSVTTTQNSLQIARLYNQCSKLFCDWTIAMLCTSAYQLSVSICLNDYTTVLLDSTEVPKNLITSVMFFKILMYRLSITQGIKYKIAITATK
jgi:hypothetical protein